MKRRNADDKFPPRPRIIENAKARRKRDKMEQKTIDVKAERVDRGME